MSITDELRHEVANYPFRDNRDFALFEAIADRIDAEHEKALREAYNKGCEDGMGMANAKGAQAEYMRGKNDGYDEGWDAGFASADDWCAQHEDAMAEHGWIRLPKDADGEYIHVGDVMEYPNGGREEVRFMTLNGAGWLVNEAGWLPVQLHHHHAPTVEDVLREFADGWDFAEGIGKGDSYMKTFAAKLRLAEED